MGRDAERLADGVVEVVRSQGDGLAVDLVRRARVVVEVGDAAGDLPAGVPERLARVQRLELGELVYPRLQLPRHPVEQAPALGGRDAAPLAERFPGGPHGVVHVPGVATRHPGQYLLRGRVYGLEGLAASGGGPLARDE